MSNDGKATALHERLRLVCELRGLSENGWSEMAGCSRDAVRQAVSRSEKDGGSMRADKLVKLADAANVSVEWLATGRGAIESGPVETGPNVPLRVATARAKRESLRKLTEAVQALIESNLRVEMARELVEAHPELTRIVGAWLAGYGLTLEEDQ